MWGSAHDWIFRLAFYHVSSQKIGWVYANAACRCSCVLLYMYQLLLPCLLLPPKRDSRKRVMHIKRERERERHTYKESFGRRRAHDRKWVHRCRRRCRRLLLYIGRPAVCQVPIRFYLPVEQQQRERRSRFLFSRNKKTPVKSFLLLVSYSCVKSHLSASVYYYL